jgi:glycosyltransferase involved in cell wall biosynthesis
MFAPCYAIVAAAARRTGARVSFVCHNAEPHERFPFAGPLTWLALGHADALLVLSRAVAAAISLRMPRHRIVQLRHPPYTRLLAGADSTAQEEWRRRIGPEGRPVVLFYGNVRPYKGLADLIASFREVRAKVPAVLAVAGTFFESVEGYRRQIADLGLEDDVKLFPDYVPDSEVAPLLGLADVVVLPYRSGSQTGIAPLAAALGKPVVATEAGGISESATTWVVRAGDPASLATAIVDSLRTPPRTDGPDATWAEWADAVLALAGHTSMQNNDAV